MSAGPEQPQGSAPTPDIVILPARPEDSGRCQEIAVAAWEPIHAERHRLLGETLHARLTGDWRAAKAGQIARAFEQHLEWIVVARASPETPAAGDGTAPAYDAQAHIAPAPNALAHDAPAYDAPAHNALTHVVGFVTFRLDHERALGTIGNNAVDPAWQGRGIATALYRHVLDRFRAEGMQTACVETGLDAGHARALAAYRKVGFDHEVPSVILYQTLSP